MEPVLFKLFIGILFTLWLICTVILALSILGLLLLVLYATTVDKDVWFSLGEKLLLKIIE